MRSSDAERAAATAQGSRYASGRVRSTPPAVQADQRARLLGAIVEIVARDGYPDAKIGDIAARAGVSRATFYELFGTKEQCLLAAQRELADKLHDEAELAIVQGETALAAHSGLLALVGFADREPREFDFLMHESMLAGSAATEERDRLMVRLAQTVERSWEQAPAGTPHLRMCPRILLEGSVRLLGLRMRRDGDAPRALVPELLGWYDCYAAARQGPSWREFASPEISMRKRSERAATSSGRPPPPNRRRRIAAEVAKRAQRERIAYATAEAILEKGYDGLTVAHIVKAAGVSRDVFYTHFHDKHEAFEQAVQLLFERLLATMAGAFFGSPGSWPEQVWQAGLAFVEFLEDDPVLANFLFVGTYAPPTYISRVHEFVLAFTVFVEYGNRHKDVAREVPRIVSEAIVCSVLEAVTSQVRHHRAADLPALVGLLTYMVFVPFMGLESASEFVRSRIGELADDRAAG
jgi:AcrR family transcriptional regulator